MLSLLGYLRDGDSTSSSISISTSTSNSSLGKSMETYLNRDSGNREEKEEKGKKKISQVQVEKRMVTYAEWAKRGQPNPTDIVLTRATVDRIRYNIFQYLHSHVSLNGSAYTRTFHWK